MDRRTVKTRKMLQDALLALLHEQAFEDIEIQAITDRADTARVTFYRHYGTKEELLADVIETIYQDMQAVIQAVSAERLMDFHLPPPNLILFDFIEQDRALYKKLFTGSISAFIQQRLRHYVVKQVLMTFSAAPQYADLPVGLIANHCASCLIGNIMWWLSEDVPYSGAYMACISHWTAMIGVMTLIGRADELTMPPPDAWRVPG
ncbi:MAG: TetR family transcriptional regulator [Anaerolineaceae bacterium]|nr:TetR family transcriptional regulator [Anaerolineaceae bacterium]